MHIVLVTHYYPPEINAPALRAYDHAQVWRDRGHKVTIITAQPSHPYGKVYEGYKNITETSEQDGVHLVRLKTRLGANKGTLTRSLNYASFMAAVWKHRKHIASPDIVISTSPQFFCGYSGRFIAKYAKCPWVLEIRDVWPDSIIAVGAAKPSLATRILSAWVDLAYRQANKIVSVSPGFNQHFHERAINKTKVALIPNGFNTDTAPVKARFSDFPELQCLNGRFLVTYVGTLGMAHSVETIIETAEILKDRDDIGFLIVGSGANREALAQLIQEKALPNIVMMGQQDRHRVRQLFNLTSASIVHLKKQDVFKTVIPTKLLEGMAMQKPILLGVEGTAKDILMEAKAGISFEPENAKDMANAVTMLADDPTQAKKFGTAGKSHVRKYYDRTKMADRYLDLLQGLV